MVLISAILPCVPVQDQERLVFSNRRAAAAASGNLQGFKVRARAQPKALACDRALLLGRLLRGIIRFHVWHAAAREHCRFSINECWLPFLPLGW